MRHGTIPHTGTKRAPDASPEPFSLGLQHAGASQEPCSHALPTIPPTDPIMQIRYGMLLHQFLEAAPLYVDAAYGLAQPQESMDFGVDVKNCVTSYNM